MSLHLLPTGLVVGAAHLAHAEEAKRVITCNCTAPIRAGRSSRAQRTHQKMLNSVDFQAGFAMQLFTSHRSQGKRKSRNIALFPFDRITEKTSRWRWKTSRAPRREGLHGPLLPLSCPSQANFGPQRLPPFRFSCSQWRQAG